MELISLRLNLDPALSMSFVFWASDPPAMADTDDDDEDDKDSGTESDCELPLCC
jgi:hypothetical protein